MDIEGSFLPAPYLRCVDVLTSAGPLTASELARAVGLTSGGLSIALERLERAGFVRRRRHDGDRRSVVVEATEHAYRREAEVFAELGTQIAELVERFSDVELRAIGDFLRATRTAVAELPIRGHDEAGGRASAVRAREHLTGRSAARFA